MEKKVMLKVKKQDMVACFTCPICNNLYDRATSISECLHTFCRKCIEDKFIVENLKACPVCNVDLGVAPLDKLRPDNILDALKCNVFKPNPKNIEEIPKNIEAEIRTTSTVLKYSRRRKRGVPSTRVSTLPPVEPEQLDKESENGFQFFLNIEQVNGLAGASTSKGCIQELNNSGNDLGKSLSATDKEIAPLKSNSTTLIVETAVTPNGEEDQNTVLNLPRGDTEEVPGDANESPVLVSSDSDTEKVSGDKQKSEGKIKEEFVFILRKISGEKGKEKAGTSSQVAISVEVEKNVEGSNKQVWFSLIATEKQNTDWPVLPQISPNYVRADGNLTVSHVKKYLAQRLGLESEDEVKLWLRQEPVCSTQKLHDLVDRWVQSTPISERVTGIAGSYGEDIVMVLHYTGSHDPL